MDPFVHFPEQRVVVCSQCKHAVLPDHIISHLAVRKKHQTSREERDRIVKAVREIQGLIYRKSELNRISFPPSHQPPIAQLQSPRHDGMQCQFHNSEGRACQYISCQRQKIREHCYRAHQWKNPIGRGRPEAGRETEVPWRSAVHCQHFFVRGEGSQFFEVARIDLQLPKANTSGNIRFEAAKNDFEQAIRRAAEEKHQQITEPEENKEPNAWLNRIGCVGHLKAFDRKVLRAYVAPVDKEDEPELQVLWKAFDWLIQDAQYHATREVVGLEALFEANKKEVDKEVTKPFDSWMDMTTVRRYTEVCKQLLLYIFRSKDCSLKDRPPYRLTERQKFHAEEVWNVLEEFVHWKEAVEAALGRTQGHQEEEESEEEVARMQLIQREIGQLWVAMLNQPLQDDEYRSALISGLAVLAMREDDGWLGAEDYTPKYSAVIKLSRLIVIEEAYKRRQQSIQQYRERGLSTDEAGSKATSYYQLTRSMVLSFMTMAHAGRDPTPMQWIYRSRSYGFKIRYTTTAEGKIQWIGDDILYARMRFGMAAFRSMVHGLVGEAREVLFEKLTMVRLDADGDVDATRVPSIDWKNLVDQPSETRVGWSFLQDERNQLSACKEWWLYERMYKEEPLQEQFLDVDGKVKRAAVIAYQRHIARMQELFWGLMMLLSQPPRAPELFGMRWKNTAYGGVRNIVIEEGLVAYVAQYHKGYRSSGDIKIIHRYLPREVGELLVYYLWLILPFWEKLQFQVTGKDCSSPFLWGNGQRREHRRWTGPKKKQEEVGMEESDNQQGVLSSAWTSERGSRILRDAAMRWIGVDHYTISPNRQVLIAISRRYCREDRFVDETSKLESGEASDEDTLEEDGPWDLQAGHGTHVAGMIYARELMEGDGSIISRREKFRRVSYMWHYWLGFASAHLGVGMSGRAKRKRQVFEEEFQDAQMARWKRLRSVDIHAELEKIVGAHAQFRSLQEDVLRAIMKHQSPILAIMATGVGKTILFQIPAKSSSSGTTVVITPIVSLQDHMVERCRQAGITCVKWDTRQSHSASQIVIVTPESAVSKTFGTFLDRLQGLCQLDRFVLDEFHTLLDSSTEFRPKMRQLGQLAKRGVQMVYLTATLPPHAEAEIMSIMNTRVEDVHIFRDRTSRPNIQYSVVEYANDTVGDGEVQAVSQMVAQKLDEYPAPAKIIVYSSSIIVAKRLSAAIDCHTYYRGVGDAQEKDRIRQQWERADGRVIIATNAFGLGIDRPDVRVVIHVGRIFQLRSYVQESGRAGRDMQQAQAIVLVPEGKQEALRKSFEQRRLPHFRKNFSVEEKMRAEQEKVDRLLSGAKCRRIYLDQEIDGRLDRARCEDGEELCDVCHENDAIIGQIETQRREHNKKEQEIESHELGRDADMSSSSSQIAETCSIGMDFWSIPPCNFQRTVGSVDEMFAANSAHQVDCKEFSAQQMRWQKQRAEDASQSQQEAHEVWNLEDHLDAWVGICALCYVQKCQGQDRTIRHDFNICPDESREIIAKEVKVLEDIQFEPYGGCFDCGVAQSICHRWENIYEGNQRFRRIPGGVCQYEGIVRTVVAAIMVVGPLEIVEQVVYAKMRVLGIWGANEKLEEEEHEQVKKRMLVWFGKKVTWASIEATALLQVFYQLTVQLKVWERQRSSRNH